MQDEAAESKSIPEEIGGYRALRELSEGRTYLAEAGGRRVVLKMLESDCLLRRQLHPMIHDRLSHVRELAHLGVANLHGVERDGEKVYLVWEWMEGESSDEATERRSDEGEVLRWAREVVLAVEGLHALGIVHGAIHERNVIVAGEGKVKLTHVSPLLYTDPEVDVAAVRQLLREWGVGEEICGEERGLTLREMARRLAAEERRDGGEVEREKESGVRVRAVLSAVAVAMIGAAVAWGIWVAVGG